MFQQLSIENHLNSYEYLNTYIISHTMRMRMNMPQQIMLEQEQTANMCGTVN